MLRVALYNPPFALSSARGLQPARIPFARASSAFPAGSVASVWRQQVVEQRDWGVRIDGGAFPEGFLHRA